MTLDEFSAEIRRQMRSRGISEADIKTAQIHFQALYGGTVPEVTVFDRMNFPSWHRGKLEVIVRLSYEG